MADVAEELLNILLSVLEPLIDYEKEELYELAASFLRKADGEEIALTREMSTAVGQTIAMIAACVKSMKERGIEMDDRIARIRELGILIRSRHRPDITLW